MIPSIRNHPIASLVTVLLALFLPPSITAYPVVYQVQEDQQRCFRFNIPSHDEAHVVILVLPTEEELEIYDKENKPQGITAHHVESWYVDHIYELTKRKTKHSGFGKPKDWMGDEEEPTSVVSVKSKYLQDNDKVSSIHIGITDRPGEDDYAIVSNTQYFRPIFFNKIRHEVAARNRAEIDQSLEGYGICLKNSSPEKSAHVIIDVVLNSEQIGTYDDNTPDDAPQKQTDFDKKLHVTPLEKSLDQSIRAAEAVLREMKYLEHREARMRETAESINTRVRWFSYLSITVLLAVTYVQVTYLKRYFHKKKLM